MTETGRERGPGGRPRQDAESAGLSDQDSRLTNSARALSLGALLSGRVDALEGIEADVELLGVPLDLPRPTNWADRVRTLEDSDVILREVGAESVIDLERTRRSSIHDRSTQPIFANQRIELWQQLGGRSQQDAIAFAWLRLLMAENDPLISASASGALSHWRRPKGASDEEIPVPLTRATATLATLRQDTDELTSAIAQAAQGVPSQAAERVVIPRSRPQEVTAESMSLLVHGTFAFTERWWYPGGDFHDFVKSKVRSDVYDAKDTFWWSGRYKAKDRKAAAEMLAGWVEAKGVSRLNTVFAHSYGGAVALQATMYGLKAKTVVLLSTPVDTYDVEWRNIDRTVSLRIHCDLVLLAARTRQRFKANVEENWIDSWFVQHGASHDPSVWIDQDWAKALGL